LGFLEIALLPIGGGKEKEAFKILDNLSNNVLRNVEKFREAAEAYTEGDIEKGDKLFVEVDKIESEADKDGLKFEYKLGEGAFLPSFRGNLSRLAESIDDTADQATDALKEIHRRPKLFEELKEAEQKDENAKVLRQGLVDIAEKAVESTQTQKKAVSVLIDDMDEAIEKAEEIHLKERDSDKIEDKLAKDLYKYEELLNPITVMQMRELISRFGGVSDSAETSGDIISSMVHALKT